MEQNSQRSNNQPHCMGPKEVQDSDALFSLLQFKKINDGFLQPLWNI